jgi:nitrate reductase gamma subunit
VFLLDGALRQLLLICTGVPAGIVILGIVCLVGALLLFMDVMMPALLKQLGEVKDILMLVLALVFIVWGLVATFADTSKYGIYGPEIFTGGFTQLAAGVCAWQLK